MFYIKIGDNFVPVEDVKSYTEDKLVIGKSAMNRYIAQRIGWEVETIEIGEDGKCEYQKYFCLSVLYGEYKKDDINILLGARL